MRLLIEGCVYSNDAEWACGAYMRAAFIQGNTVLTTQQIYLPLHWDMENACAVQGSNSDHSELFVLSQLLKGAHMVFQSLLCCFLTCVC